MKKLLILAALASTGCQSIRDQHVQELAQICEKIFINKHTTEAYCPKAKRLGDK